MNDQIQHLHGILQTEKNRYVYFLLAISAASIAFAISQTKELALSTSQIPLAIAVLFWSLSFFHGCRNRVFDHSALLMNLENLRVQSGLHELSGSNPVAIKIGTDFTMSKFKESEKKLVFHGQWQFWTYVIGSTSFVLWHIYEMYLRT